MNTSTSVVEVPVITYHGQDGSMMAVIPDPSDRDCFGAALAKQIRRSANHDPDMDELEETAGAILAAYEGALTDRPETTHTILEIQLGGYAFAIGDAAALAALRATRVTIH